MTSLFQIFLEDPIYGLVLFIALVLSLGLHEAAHAYTTYWLGDPTPKLQDRLTLNPIKHLDPVGTIFILFAGIGWGKPVQFNPYNLKNPQRDAAIIAFVGPLTNIVIACLAGIIYWFLGTGGSLAILASVFIGLNLGLAVFNMIPVDPLDGFKVVGGLLPPYWARKWYETQQYGIFVLMFLLFTGAIGRIIDPVTSFLFRFLFFYLA